VPFGEFIPARALLEWFPPLDQIPRDAQPATAPQSMEVVDGVQAAVIICFETIFASIVRTNLLAGDAPAQIAFSLTNDASFGDSAEPAQHLAQTQLRAVETGRWFVHAALSGSSAFVAPDGRVEQATALFTVDSIRTEVPLVTGYTPYLAVGDVIGWVTRTVVLLAAAFLVLASLRRPRAPGTDG
jgi:apolipoprotein N-acyltransferase